MDNTYFIKNVFLTIPLFCTLTAHNGLVNYTLVLTELLYQ